MYDLVVLLTAVPVQYFLNWQGVRFPPQPADGMLSFSGGADNEKKIFFFDWDQQSSQL